MDVVADQDEGKEEDNKEGTEEAAPEDRPQGEPDGNETISRGENDQPGGEVKEKRRTK